MNLYDYLKMTENNLGKEPEYLPPTKLEKPGPNVYEVATEDLHIKYETLLLEFASANDNLKTIREKIDDVKKQLADCALFKSIKED